MDVSKAQKAGSNIAETKLMFVKQFMDQSI